MERKRQGQRFHSMVTLPKRYIFILNEFDKMILNKTIRYFTFKFKNNSADINNICIKLNTFAIVFKMRLQKQR